MIDSIDPGSLAEALPNREVIAATAGGEIRTNWSDLVVTGEVVSVQPGSAVRYLNTDPTSSGDEEQVVEVDFDDPGAHGRNVLVRVRPDWSAGDEVSNEVVFRLGMFAEADPEEYLASLRSLKDKHVVAVLDTRESGRHRGDYLPIMGAGLFGWIEEDGALTFPGLGEKGKAFMGETDTLKELRAEATRPRQEVRLP